MSKKTALVVGATGVVGRNLLSYLSQVGGWNVLAVARRQPDVPGDWTHIPIDLLDRLDCEAKAPLLAATTHIFFSAYIERKDQQAWVDDNTAMMVNLIEAIEPHVSHLKHIHVVHGTKWYGNHIGPFKTPAKEDDPRHMSSNFYYNQWDWLQERSRSRSWTCSSARPHAICGFAIGNPMNLPMVIAIYAILSRELGMPLHFPGTAGNWHALYQATDATLLAHASVWMATTDRCAGEAFNITNGDLIRWKNLWPRIASYWNMSVGQRRSLNLTRMMEDKGAVWDKIVQQHSLNAYSYEKIVSWPYGDHVFQPDYDIISDTGKCRRYGFFEFVDTEQMFFDLWDKYREAHILPP